VTIPSIVIIDNLTDLVILRSPPQPASWPGTPVAKADNWWRDDPCP